jgi:hypothetical protein
VPQALRLTRGAARLELTDHRIDTAECKKSSDRGKGEVCIDASG